MWGYLQICYFLFLSHIMGSLQPITYSHNTKNQKSLITLNQCVVACCSLRNVFPVFALNPRTKPAMARSFVSIYIKRVMARNQRRRFISHQKVPPVSITPLFFWASVMVAIFPSSVNQLEQGNKHISKFKENPLHKVLNHVDGLQVPVRRSKSTILNTLMIFRSKT